MSKLYKTLCKSAETLSELSKNMPWICLVGSLYLICSAVFPQARPEGLYPAVAAFAGVSLLGSALLGLVLRRKACKQCNFLCFFVWSVLALSVGDTGLAWLGLASSAMAAASALFFLTGGAGGRERRAA